MGKSAHYTRLSISFLVSCCLDTILLTDAALCRSTEAYLRFCGLAHEVKSRRNAEFMSPTGNVPFLRANEELVCDFSGITAYIESKGFSTSQDFEVKDRASLRAYLSLVENSLYPAEVLKEFQQTCQALSEKLGKNRFFINDRPTELDALVFGHLHSVLTRYLPDNSLRSIIKEYKNLEDFEVINYYLIIPLCFWDNGSCLFKQSRPLLSAIHQSKLYCALLFQVLKEFQQTCQALSEKLGKNRFFINDRPTELDALVFGHLHSVLTRYLPDNSLSSIIKEYKNLEDFVMTILREYFHQ
ncbi:PREDICTED: metaxin-2-like [Acropora digitifera]|uniref:metaxin-2-like n=1 Tax=Acropora digitifera TaxID=70779 RepID=UPI00077A3F2F|nr:PREDICTED: metaxin-2-like [Acropora digitifera]